MQQVRTLKNTTLSLSFNAYCYCVRNTEIFVIIHCIWRSQNIFLPIRKLESTSRLSTKQNPRNLSSLKSYLFFHHLAKIKWLTHDANIKEPCGFQFSCAFLTRTSEFLPDCCDNKQKKNKRKSYTWFYYGGLLCYLLSTSDIQLITLCYSTPIHTHTPKYLNSLNEKAKENAKKDIFLNKKKEGKSRITSRHIHTRTKTKDMILKTCYEMNLCSRV